MKKIVLSTIVCSALSINLMASSSLVDALKGGKVDVDFTGYYQTIQTEDRNFGETGSNRANLGLKIGYESDSFHDLKIGTVFYGTETLKMQDSMIKDTVEGGINQDKALLGELYLKHNSKSAQTAFVLGRQKVDTPLLNSFNDNMVPTLYEGVIGVKAFGPKAGLYAGWIERVRLSIDGTNTNGEAPEFTQFNELIGKNFMFGFLYNEIPGTEVQGFYYNLGTLMNASFGEVKFHLGSDAILKGQIIDQKFENNDPSTQAYAAQLEKTFNKSIKVYGAYSSVKDNSVYALGTDPLYTSNTLTRVGGDIAGSRDISINGSVDYGTNGMTTITGAAAKDTDAWKVGFDVEVDKGTSFRVSYTDLKNDTTDAVEMNAGLTVKANKNVKFDIDYMTYEPDNIALGQKTEVVRAVLKFTF